MDETQTDIDWGFEFGERLNDFINRPENLPSNVWQAMALEHKLVAFQCVQLESFASGFMYKMDKQETGELLAIKFYDWSCMLHFMIDKICQKKGPKQG